MPWYCLHVASNTERLVRDRLAETAGIEAFYPFVPVTSKDGRRITEKKFFPGYVFARFELAERTPVIQLPQVIQILGMGGHRAASIPNHEIEAVRQMVQSASASVTPCPYVASGTAVTVTAGPLRGLEGFVVYAAEGHSRVVVSVQMLQRSISAEVDSADIEVLKPLTNVIPFPAPRRQIEKVAA